MGIYPPPQLGHLRHHDVSFGSRALFSRRPQRVRSAPNGIPRLWRRDFTAAPSTLFAAFAIEQIDAIASFADPIQQYFSSWCKAYETIYLEVVVGNATLLVDELVN